MKINRLGYITSMATGGLAGFNFKEIVELNQLGVQIVLFVTKYRPGPYMAPAGVTTYRISALHSLLELCRSALFSPVTTARILFSAVQTGCLMDAFIAYSWARHMLNLRVDHIHCHWADHKLYIGHFVHRITGLPLSVTLHGYDLYANPNWKMCEIALQSCRRIVTISNYNRELLIRRFGALGERVQTVRLFTDMPEVAESLADKTKLLIVGGFQDRKGYDILLQALQELDRLDIHLWIVGYKGPVDVPGLVRNLGLERKVTIYGHVSDDVLRLLYIYCDVFVMPSRMDRSGVGEGLPVALMEAMSHGKPVIATRHTGIPELVEEILVPENDVQSLKTAIGYLADHPQIRTAMGQRNREIVHRQYNKANVAQLLHTLEA